MDKVNRDLRALVAATAILLVAAIVIGALLMCAVVRHDPRNEYDDMDGAEWTTWLIVGVPVFLVTLVATVVGWAYYGIKKTLE
jgi:heme/copper-type cytochrome/quinol oxidase subunit 2